MAAVENADINNVDDGVTVAAIEVDVPAIPAAITATADAACSRFEAAEVLLLDALEEEEEEDEETT